MSDHEAQASSSIDRRRRAAIGPILLLVSAIAFSTAGFFVRSIRVDSATMLFWRNLLGAAILLPFVLRQFPRLIAVGNPRPMVSVALSAFGSICYIAAFASTSVANISIIYAASPMLTAALAAAFLREQTTGRTSAAAALAFAGVSITAFGGGGLRAASSGDGLAMLMTLALSTVAVLSRGQSLPPLALSCATSLVAAAAMLPARPRLFLPAQTLFWLAAFGAVTMAAALPCYLLGLRTVHAGRAMLISALELPLAPLWVWLAYGEAPSLHAAMGGAVVTVAVLWDLSASSD